LDLHERSLEIPYTIKIQDSKAMAYLLVVIMDTSKKVIHLIIISTLINIKVGLGIV
jgi:hypothetical protein